MKPSDEWYDDFVEVWRQQAGWSHETYYWAWRWGLRIWPRNDGQVRRGEALSFWVWRWRKSGLSDQEIADRLGYQLDTLRRRGVLQFADAHDSRTRGPRVRAPLVVAIEREAVPHQFDTWYDPRLAVYWPGSVKRVHEELAYVTRAGARGEIGGELMPVEVPRPQPEQPRKPKKVTTDTREIARFFRLHSGEQP